MTLEQVEQTAKAHLGKTAAVENANGRWTIVTLVPVHNPQGGPPIRIEREVEGEGSTPEEALMRAGVVMRVGRSDAAADGTFTAEVNYICRQDNCGKFVSQLVRAEKSGSFGAVCPHCGGTSFSAALRVTEAE